MEYDVYTNQADKDDLLRIQLGWYNATFGAMAKGMIIAAGAGALLKGVVPMFDLGIAAAMPNLVPELSAFTKVKKAIDPNNIAARRWEYDNERMKKFIMF